MTGRDSDDREHGCAFDENGLTPEQRRSGSDGGAEVPAPADLSAIQADDALLDALSGSDPQLANELGDHELNALLLAWRRDIDSEPIPELADTDTAVVTIKTAALARRNGGRPRRRRMLVPVAAAAAVLAIGFTGTALAARDAQPGDTLWALTTVLYSDHASSVQAAASVRTELDEASLALAQQRFDDARRALESAQSSLGKVSLEDDLAVLKARHNQLLGQLKPGGTGGGQPTTTTPGTSSQQQERPTDVSSLPAPVLPPEQSTPEPSDATPTPSDPTTSTPAPPTSSSVSGSDTGTESGTGTGNGGEPLGASAEGPQPAAPGG